MSAGLELVKWLAFAAMVADHVDYVMLDRSSAVLHAIGRFAMPAFAVAFGMGLARSRDPQAVAARLLVPGVVAQLAWTVAPVEYAWLNPLLVFAACALVSAGLRQSEALGWGFGLVVLAAGVFGALDGGVWPVLLVWAAYLSARLASAWPNVLAAVPWVLGAPFAGVVLGLAAPHVGHRVRWGPPRVAGALAWGYAGHLWLLVVIRTGMDLARTAT